MFVPLLMIAAAAVLAWLSVFDRMSPVALAVVQVESSFGIPLWPPFAIAGLVLLVVRLLHARRPQPASPPRPLTRDAARARPPAPTPASYDAPPPASPPADGGWLTTIRASARTVSDDPMGRVRFDDGAGVPVALVLTAVTKEQARRRVSAYAAWLATIPTPPTARVRAVSSPDLEGPVHAMFRGELARHFRADAFHVTSIRDGADAVFVTPDPRWSP